MATTTPASEMEPDSSSRITLCKAKRRGESKSWLNGELRSWQTHGVKWRKDTSSNKQKD